VHQEDNDMSLKNLTGKHLTLEDREYIQAALERGIPLADMADRLRKDPTTISKEIKRNRVIGTSEFNGLGGKCQNHSICRKRYLCDTKCDRLCKRCTHSNCYKICAEYLEKTCSRLSRYPHVCNGCENRATCRLRKIHYRARIANEKYKDTLITSREGIDLSQHELVHLDELISPLVMKGQSLKHIHAHHQLEIGCSQRTLYNYFEWNLFTARNIDLPRKVKMKPRKKNKEGSGKPQQYREGRTYEDFLAFTLANPDVPVVEMDTVHGTRSGKVILTLFFRNTGLMIGILLNHCTQECVLEAIDWLYEKLGEKIFESTFPVLLTDNGSEFKIPPEIETTEDGCIRTKVFYCDPMASYQKPHIEKNHEFIRYVLPKGRTFKNLTQEKVTLMMNHINSTVRASLNDQTPWRLAQLLMNDSVLEALSLKEIPANEVHLKPALIK
jgi:IS30 family transposase